MKYYKDLVGKVYAFESDGSQDSFINGDFVEVFGDELVNLLKPSDLELISNRLSEIKGRLVQIDSLSVRPLRAIAMQTESVVDTDKLRELEDERAALVSEMVALNG